MIKNPPAMQETQVQSLGREGPLEKRIRTHLTILAWRILWTEEPSRLCPQGYKESDTTEQLTLSLFIFKTYLYLPPLYLNKQILSTILTGELTNMLLRAKIVLLIIQIFRRYIETP